MRKTKNENNQELNINIGKVESDYRSIYRLLSSCNYVFEKAKVKNEAEHKLRQDIIEKISEAKKDIKVLIQSQEEER